MEDLDTNSQEKIYDNPIEKTEKQNEAKLADDDRPILRDLYDHVVQSVAVNWRDLGVKLLHPTQIEQRVLEVIAADHPHSVENCCKRMFEKWLSTQEDASWKQLLEALKSMQLNQLASQIENKSIKCTDKATKSYTNLIGVNDDIIDLNHHTCMHEYGQYLKRRYQLLDITSIDNQLDCSSLKYIDLNISNQERHVHARKKRNITLAEALNVETERKKVVLIKGDPGMGKSTLAINICKCWAEGSLLQTYNAVILLTLRDPEIQAAKNISDLLLILDEEMRKNVHKMIARRLGDRICFILEGYDELPEQLRKSSVFTKLKENLPNCTLVYTSRPEACDKLESVASRVVKIEGFKTESVNEYISNTFENVDNGANLASQLKSQLDDNSTVREILHIPINVAIVCLIFFHISTLPETLTELYTLLCLRLILRYITLRTDNVAQVEKLQSLDHLPVSISEQFSQLCFIAYKGTENGNIIFTSQHLLDIGIVENKISDLGLLVTAPSTSVYGREKSYNFLHKILQEFCTAWYISKLSLKDQLKCIKIYWNYNKFKMVWRLYSGITGLNNKEVLNCIPLPYKLVKSNLTKKKLEHLMDCIYEAHNSELCQIVGDHLDGNFNFGVDFYNYRMKPCRANLIAYFLTHYKGVIRETHFGALCCTIKSQKIFEALKKCHVTDNFVLFPNAGYASVERQSCAILNTFLSTDFPVVELYINEIQFLTDSLDPQEHITDMKLLSQVLTSSKTLRVLDISKSDIREGGAACFASLRHILLHDLRMSDCTLGPRGVDKIGEMLHHNNSIASLDLSDNFCGNKGVERLVYHLNGNCNLQHLNLSSNNITDVGADQLTKLIANDRLTSIELSDNPLGFKGVHRILFSLPSTMEHIGLEHIGLEHIGLEHIGLEHIGLEHTNLAPTLCFHQYLCFNCLTQYQFTQFHSS